MENIAEYTHFLCKDIQKWLSREGLTWRVVEEYNFFKVTSYKGNAKVQPTKHCVTVKFFHPNNTTTSTNVPLGGDVASVLKAILE